MQAAINRVLAERRVNFKKMSPKEESANTAIRAISTLHALRHNRKLQKEFVLIVPCEYKALKKYFEKNYGGENIWKKE